MRNKAQIESKTKQKMNGLLDVQTRFPDEQTCRDFFEKARWNGNSSCPHCKSERISKRFKDGKTYFCGECRKPFTVKIGTIFEDSALPMQKWFFAIYLMTAHKKGVSSCQLSRDIQVTQKTAWFMLQRIRHAMKTKSLFKQIKGTVEVDETYVGGKATGTKITGRGAKNKTIVFGMAERNGEVRAQIVTRVNGDTLKPIIRENVDKDAVIMSDEHGGYYNLKAEFKGHEIVKHGKKEYARGGVHVNNIENFWSMLKRGILGIYHHTSKEHLHRYVDEFQYRYNSRKDEDTDRFTSILGQCEGRLTYATLIN